MVWEGCKTHRVVTGPMNCKKSGFFTENRAPGVFGAPGCNLNTLIDLANTALASEGPGKTTRMISEGYRTHRGVTGSMNFKKLGRFFRKIVLPGFWGPWLPSKHSN